MSHSAHVGTTTVEHMREPVVDLIDEFFLARQPKKHSEHTLAAYRRDLSSVLGHAAEVLGVEPTEVRIGDLDVRTLRRAFARISHQSAATISRTWSTWNQLFTFLVADGILAGNPMAAVEKPPRAEVQAEVDHRRRQSRAPAQGGGNGPQERPKSVARA